MLRDLAQHDQRDDVVLTEGLNGPEKRRRMAGDEVRAVGTGGARGGSCCRGSPDSYAPRVDAWGSCEGVTGVREVRGSPAARNHEGGASHRRQLRVQFRHGQGLGSRAEASGSFLAARRSYCGGCGGLGRGGAA
jgi:hypothetical protein